MSNSSRHATRLIVLGAVHQFQPVHGYFVRRELMTWHVDEWANMHAGSIYNALRTLKKDGYLLEDGTETEGNRPERTTYSVTEEGEVEFLRLLRQSIWNVEPFDTVSATMLVSFMYALSRKEIISALEHRLTEIDARIKTNGFNVADVAQSKTTPVYVREIFELSSARLQGEKQWTLTLLGRIKDGEYFFAGETPNMPDRRHSTRR
ncbi:PadR family transcriptional regulator [Devosia pacifica]|uniref:PadR family transcriptional regulator n=1 Tax=Devosia pacifica TaxID=1335967 RepID=A0A918RUR5_9HYPH|nr:PadR family transcriptional regulator [Devosia pacifica]GHA09989.1 PadR family transcriptional regulator [Devosia pacifica]